MKKIADKIINIIVFVNQFLLAQITSIVFNIFADFSVVGRENLPESKCPFIFAANHASEVDPLLVGVAISIKRFPIYFVTKSKKDYSWKGWRRIFYNNFVWGLVGSRLAKSGLKNYELSLQKHIDLLNRGHNLCIFPEGRRASDGQIQNPRGGVSFLAYKTKILIVPIGISGVYRISLKKLLFHRIKVTVNIGKPVDVKEFFPNKKELTTEELKYFSYQVMYYRIKPLINSH